MFLCFVGVNCYLQAQSPSSACCRKPSVCKFAVVSLLFVSLRRKPSVCQLAVVSLLS